MINLINQLAKRIWPDLKSMSRPRMMVGIGDVITSIYASIVFLIGLIWLIRETDLTVIVSEWEIFLFFLAIIALFTYLNFFMIIEFREDRYGSADGAFNSMMVWVVAFIFGPTSLWLMLILQSAQFISTWPRLASTASKWNSLRNFTLSCSGFTVPFLIGLKVYEMMGGEFPIKSLNFEDVVAGFTGILVNFGALVLIWTPYFLYALYTQKQVSKSSNLRPVVQFFFMALALPTFAHPFSILAAGLYSNNGLFSFLFFIVGLVVVAYMARQFSHLAESNRQQSRQLDKLESLGRSILTAPPDMSTLPELLAEHLPTMFSAAAMVVWIIPGQILFKSPEELEMDLSPIWDWANDTKQSHAFTSAQTPPWSSTNQRHRPLVFSPILAHEGKEVIGGIYLELRQLAQPWNHLSLQKLFPAVQTLGDQIASAIHRSEEFARSIALEKVSQEIQIAGQIQASFLPNQFPNIPGWQLAVTLEPAGGLSGDFFDLIPLSRGRLGLVIADVADKGLGAALYMALCRTLIRTYAFEYPARPDLVLSEANERILQDARANLFITCFYGVLDPEEGTLTYTNAGHNPPIMVKTGEDSKVFALVRTGMPLGIESDASWDRSTISFTAGDKLILYTDGITEAQNGAGDFYDENFLVETIMNSFDGSAFQLQDEILKQVKLFTDGAPQYDDITLMILERESDD